jgi:hypothetical protein
MGEPAPNLTSSVWYGLDGLVRWPSAQAQDWALRALPQLAADTEVLAVVFFGSAVRKVRRPGDLDCLIIYGRRAPLLLSVPIDVDVRSYAASQVEALIEKGHDILGWALRFGVLAHEKRRYWSHLCETWSGRLPMPSLSSALHRAERASKLSLELANMGDVEASEEQSLSSLTHRARAALLEKGVFPISRPELPNQLRSIGEQALASALEAALQKRDHSGTYDSR